MNVGAIAVLFVLFLAAEWASFRRTGEPRRHPDTNVFMWKAEAPLLSETFLMTGKPPATALLFKLAGRDARTIARAQSNLSVICWFCLALAVAAELRSLTARLAAVVSICLYSLSTIVNQWDYVLLSESLAFSLLALSLAATLVLTRRLADPAFAGDGKLGLPLVSAWAGVCFLLTLTRDSYAYLVATLWSAYALWLGIDALRRRSGGRSPRVHRRLACAVAVLASLLLASYLAMSGSERWRTPLVNVILQRIVIHPEIYEEWTTRYGLPRNPTFEKYAGKRAWAPTKADPPLRDRFWNRDPAVEDVRLWLDERGRSAYQRYLFLDHPASAVRSSFEAFAAEVNSRFVEKQFGKGAGGTWWTARLSAWTYQEVRHPVSIWVAVLAAGIALAIFVPSSWLLGLASVFLAFSAWAQAFINFHGDTSNVARHMVMCGTLLRLAVLFLALVGLDRILDSVSHSCAAPPPDRGAARGVGTRLASTAPKSRETTCTAARPAARAGNVRKYGIRHKCGLPAHEEALAAHPGPSPSVTPCRVARSDA